MTVEENVALLAAERATIHVCADCGGRAHCYDRCPADRRRKWTRVVPAEYVRADIHEQALELLRRVVVANASSSGCEFPGQTLSNLAAAAREFLDDARSQA